MTSSNGRSCVIKWLKSPILGLQILLQCRQEVPDGREMWRCWDIYLYFLYAVSPPREVDGLSQIWPLPGIWFGAKVDRSAAIRSQALMSICLFFMSYLAVSFNCFLWPPCVLVPCVSCANSTCPGSRLSDILIQWPAQRSWFCITIASISKSIGAAIFSSDTKYLYEATLVEFLYGLQMTSVCKPTPRSRSNTTLLSFVMLWLSKTRLRSFLKDVLAQHIRCWISASMVAF